MSKISLRHCPQCGVPHVPPDVAAKVRAGEIVDVEIVYGSGVAGNVLRWGTGAINIDGCRVAGNKSQRGERLSALGRMNDDAWRPKATIAADNLGRWPANLITDGSEEVVGAFPESESGVAVQRNGGGQKIGGNGVYGGSSGLTRADIGFGDSGSAARFFYTAKADSDDRLGSKHPTVKPLDLMQYLVRLVTPPRGLILDPFAGTGTTGEAAWREGFSAILIEREAEYLADIERRMGLCLAGPDERARESIKARLKDKPVDHGPLFGEAAA